MKDKMRRWEILGKLKGKTSIKAIEKVLLLNRGLKTPKEKKEFLDPTHPEKVSLAALGIDKKEIGKAVRRIAQAKKSGELIIVYGDYDADGICGTALLWERLYSLGLNVLPYIPERFSEGYGLNLESIKRLKKRYPTLGLVITVDHGIVANKVVEAANRLGIDAIISDHHEPGKKRPKAHATVHTTKIGGASVAWILAREIKKSSEGLELAAIGTISDQLPLIGPNRSLTKWGIEALNQTQRLGLIALFNEAGVVKGSIGPYEIGFMIAPRINAMGRLVHAIDSLRLLCTKKKERAIELARLLNRTNQERQRIVEEVVLHARGSVVKGKGIIVLAHESYHEGVIGLAAARLVEEFYRPAIVISKKGEIAKASARSISGFNIIAAIRRLEDYILEGGGHPMAAGFSLKTERIAEFSNKLNEIGSVLLTPEILTKRLKIDLEIDFGVITSELLKLISAFEPTGLGNPSPTFATRGVSILSARVVGRDGMHLKLSLAKDGQVFNGIAFGFGEIFQRLSPEAKVDIAFNVEENSFAGRTQVELKIKDLKLK
ncbi:MAG: single-stranded-DNA-specific exonuclease RecJ [Patescibacteria group bacterium]